MSIPRTLDFVKPNNSNKKACPFLSQTVRFDEKLGGSRVNRESWQVCNASNAC